MLLLVFLPEETILGFWVMIVEWHGKQILIPERISCAKTCLQKYNLPGVKLLRSAGYALQNIYLVKFANSNYLIFSATIICAKTHQKFCLSRVLQYKEENQPFFNCNDPTTSLILLFKTKHQIESDTYWKVRNHWNSKFAKKRNCTPKMFPLNLTVNLDTRPQKRTQLPGRSDAFTN